MCWCPVVPHRSVTKYCRVTVYKTLVLSLWNVWLEGRKLNINPTDRTVCALWMTGHFMYKGRQVGPEEIISFSHLNLSNTAKCKIVSWFKTGIYFTVFSVKRIIIHPKSTAIKMQNLINIEGGYIWIWWGKTHHLRLAPGASIDVLHLLICCMRKEMKTFTIRPWSNLTSWLPMTFEFRCTNPAGNLWRGYHRAWVYTCVCVGDRMCVCRGAEGCSRGLEVKLPNSSAAARELLTDQPGLIVCAGEQGG